MWDHQSQRERPSGRAATQKPPFGEAPVQSGSGSRADLRRVARHKTGIGPVQLPRPDREGNRQPTDGQRGTGASQSSAPVRGLSAVHERRGPVGSDDRVASGILSFYDGHCAQHLHYSQRLQSRGCPG